MAMHRRNKRPGKETGVPSRDIEGNSFSKVEFSFKNNDKMKCCPSVLRGRWKTDGKYIYQFPRGGWRNADGNHNYARAGDEEIKAF